MDRWDIFLDKIKRVAESGDLGLLLDVADRLVSEARGESWRAEIAEIDLANTKNGQFRSDIKHFMLGTFKSPPCIQRRDVNGELFAEGEKCGAIRALVFPEIEGATFYACHNRLSLIIGEGAFPGDYRLLEYCFPEEFAAASDNREVVLACAYGLAEASKNPNNFSAATHNAFGAGAWRMEKAEKRGYFSFMEHGQEHDEAVDRINSSAYWG